MRHTPGGSPAESLDAMLTRVLASFARQAMMATLGFLHAGAVAAVLDSACGYAAFSRCRPKRQC